MQATKIYGNKICSRMEYHNYFSFCSALMADMIYEFLDGMILSSRIFSPEASETWIIWKIKFFWNFWLCLSSDFEIKISSYCGR